MRIKIVSDNDHTGGIFIKESDEFGYALGHDNTEISCESDLRKPIHLSYLKLKLQQRSWNNPLRRHVTPTGNLAVRMDNLTDPIDTLDQTGDSGIIISNLSGVDEDSIKNKLNSIITDMEKNNIYLYDVSHSVIDLLRNTVMYKIIDYDSDVYTNTISLNNVSYGLVYPGCRGRVELSVQYSKGDKIYSHDTMFETLINDSKKIIIEDFRKTINNDVVIEYVGNVIKVLPISSEVDECIISDCILTYGNI